MPKATLSFNLPEERPEYTSAINGADYLSTLQEFDNFLRGKIKYEELSDAEYLVYQSIRDKLHETANNNDITIWD